MKKYLCLLCAICFCYALLGCEYHINHSSVNSTHPSGQLGRQRLNISTIYDSSIHFTTFTPDDLGGNYPEDITYIDLTDVTIEIDGTEYPLDAAIRDGHTTVDQIIADARFDAKNGFCKELYESENGLTRFVYQYPDFELEYAYDVLEAPDGSQHLIQDFAVYPVNKHISVTHGLTTTNENGYPISLTREDWGISLEISNVTSTGITLTCTQSGGQQIGELFARSYFIDLQDGKASGWDLEVVTVQCDDAIRMDGTTELYFDWSEDYGELPSDKYVMVLYLADDYDSNDVHPLMQNFADEQRYFIEFTIP